MSFETVNYELSGTVATITMNRPDALNALSLQLTKDLRAAIEKAVEERARALILTGNGKAFCAGGDLREMQAIGQHEGKIEAFLDAPLKALHNVIRQIRKTPVPFIAAVNGVCAGAGVNFALACDIVIAANDAAFREAFVRIGLTPDCGGTFFLPRAIGEKLATEMFMTGDSITAERAVQIGMINHVVPAALLLEEAGKLASRLASGPTASLGRIKRMMNATFSNDFNEQLEMEAACQIESGRGPDFKEGVDAFFGKRAPNFSGN
ncbi:MAG: enoyl-CoA hydratase-related protein [Pyrinomonadaceae bacterium]